MNFIVMEDEMGRREEEMREKKGRRAEAFLQKTAGFLGRKDEDRGKEGGRREGGRREAFLQKTTGFLGRKEDGGRREGGRREAFLQKTTGFLGRKDEEKGKEEGNKEEGNREEGNREGGRREAFLQKTAVLLGRKEGTTTEGETTEKEATEKGGRREAFLHKTTGFLTTIKQISQRGDKNKEKEVQVDGPMLFTDPALGPSEPRLENMEQFWEEQNRTAFLPTENLPQWFPYIDGEARKIDVDSRPLQFILAELAMAKPNSDRAIMELLRPSEVYAFREYLVMGYGLAWVRSNPVSAR